MTKRSEVLFVSAHVEPRQERKKEGFYAGKNRRLPFFADASRGHLLLDHFCSAGPGKNRTPPGTFYLRNGEIGWKRVDQVNPAELCGGLAEISRRSLGK
jgi:hypothetical protein